MDVAIRTAEQKIVTTPQHAFNADVEKALNGHCRHHRKRRIAEQKRWYAVKLLERDEKVLETIQLTDAQKQQIER